MNPDLTKKLKRSALYSIYRPLANNTERSRPLDTESIEKSGVLSELKATKKTKNSMLGLLLVDSLQQFEED